jgi:hypothetical protein
LKGTELGTVRGSDSLECVISASRTLQCTRSTTFQGTNLSFKVTDWAKSISKMRPLIRRTLDSSSNQSQSSRTNGAVNLLLCPSGFRLQPVDAELEHLCHSAHIAGFTSLVAEPILIARPQAPTGTSTLHKGAGFVNFWSDSISVSVCKAGCIDGCVSIYMSLSEC